ncbi:MAG TPA: putative sugar O-methyltransferase [Allosphingosinicella sp.]|nr:putative sugar O-methyltransferase [Allosphingosinicella sp.]
MSLRSFGKRLNEVATERLGARLVRTQTLYPWQMQPAGAGACQTDRLPAGARDYLCESNRRLQELARRYAAFDPRVMTPASWVEEKLDSNDLLYFRGDNAFVWQSRDRNHNELSYALVYYALKADGAGALLERLSEDFWFGIHLFEIDGRSVSRDLLDSVREIEFLQDHVGLGRRPINLLDIGAGYGRLPYRLSQLGLDDLRIFAADAYAKSTFIAEYYLGFRSAQASTVVPLDEVDELLQCTGIDVAVNVHSFSECTPDAVSWWVERLAANDVKYLMVVPNAGRSAGERCETNSGFDLESIFARFGYRPAIREPRYRDPLVQKYGIDPVYLHLFERK